jgi:hypothetical protein
MRGRAVMRTAPHRRGRLWPFTIAVAIAFVVAIPLLVDSGSIRPASLAAKMHVDAANDRHRVVACGDLPVAEPAAIPARIAATYTTTIATWSGDAPVPSVLLTFAEVPRFGLHVDWNAAATRHEVHEADDAKLHRVLVARDHEPAVVSRCSLDAASLRVDLRRIAPIRVVLTGVPTDLRERAVVEAVVRHDDEGAVDATTAAATYAMRTGFPTAMPLDHAELPRARRAPGRVRVWARSLATDRTFALAEAPFTVDQCEVAIDAAGIAGPPLSDVDLLLEFAHEYPAGQLHLSLQATPGTNLWTEQFERRPDERFVRLRLRDLPRGRLSPVLSEQTTTARFPLATWTLSAASHEIRAEVVADATLRVDVAGVCGDASNVRILVRGDDGGIAYAGEATARGAVATHSIERVTAGRYHVQALATGGTPPRPWASFVRVVDVETRQARAVALDLLPAGEVTVHGSTASADEPFLDLRPTPGGQASRHHLAPHGLRRFWCPTGRYEVVWRGGTLVLDVAEANQVLTLQR